MSFPDWLPRQSINRNCVVKRIISWSKLQWALLGLTNTPRKIYSWKNYRVCRLNLCMDGNFMACRFDRQIRALKLDMSSRLLCLHRAFHCCAAFKFTLQILVTWSADSCFPPEWTELWQAVVSLQTVLLQLAKTRLLSEVTICKSESCLEWTFWLEPVNGMAFSSGTAEKHQLSDVDCLEEKSGFGDFRYAHYVVFETSEVFTSYFTYLALHTVILR